MVYVDAVEAWQKYGCLRREAALYFRLQGDKLLCFTVYLLYYTGSKCLTAQLKKIKTFSPLK
jgi:hypothetical protein